MVLTSGERAVWAAAFALARKDALDELANTGDAPKWLPPHAYEDAIMEAVGDAADAVRDMRRAGLDFEDVAGSVEQAEHETKVLACTVEPEPLLRAMLGEE